jgi:hypothetical protein
MTAPHNQSQPVCESDAPLSVKYVLLEAREGQRYHAQNNAPYTAQVLGDCIAIIEYLYGRLAAKEPTS